MATGSSLQVEAHAQGALAELGQSAGLIGPNTPAGISSYSTSSLSACY